MAVVAGLGEEKSLAIAVAASLGGTMSGTGYSEIGSAAAFARLGTVTGISNSEISAGNGVTSDTVCAAMGIFTFDDMGCANS